MTLESRFEGLPMELKKMIISKVHSPIDLLELHLVNRSISEIVVEDSFPNIRKLSVHVARKGRRGESNRINGEVVHSKDVIRVIISILKLAKQITHMQLSGRLLTVDWLDSARLLVLEEIKKAMAVHRYPITIFEVNVHVTVLNDIPFSIFALGDIKDILQYISASVQKVDLAVESTSRMIPQPELSGRTCFEVLANCTNLKVIRLENIFLDSRAARAVTLDKPELTSITILYDDDDPPVRQTGRNQFRLGIRAHANEIALGLFWGLDKTAITHLHLELAGWSVDGNSFPALYGIFPLLTNLTVTVVQPRDIRKLQRNLSVLMAQFPNLQCLHIKSSLEHKHIERLSNAEGPETNIVSFFNQVLPTLDMKGCEERKLRVCYSSSSSAVECIIIIIIGTA